MGLGERLLIISHSFVSPITYRSVSSLSNTYMAGTALFVVSADDMILPETLIGHKLNRTHARQTAQICALQPSGHVERPYFKLSGFDQLEL